MVMAAGAVDGEAEKCLAGGGDHVIELVHPRLHAVGGFIIPDAEAIKACGGDAIGRERFELITGHLFLHKLIVRLVFVERFDHIIAESPGVWFDPVALETIRLGIANHIKPMPRPFLAVAWAGEQSIDDFLKCVGGGVIQKCFGFGGCGRQTGQVVIGPPQQHGLGRRWRGGEMIRFQLREYKSVDRRFDPLRLFHGGNNRPLYRLERPEFHRLGIHLRDDALGGNLGDAPRP